MPSAFAAQLSQSAKIHAYCCFWVHLSWAVTRPLRKHGIADKIFFFFFFFRFWGFRTVCNIVNIGGLLSVSALLPIFDFLSFLPCFFLASRLSRRCLAAHFVAIQEATSSRWLIFYHVPAVHVLNSLAWQDTYCHNVWLSLHFTMQEGLMLLSVAKICLVGLSSICWTHKIGQGFWGLSEPPPPFILPKTVVALQTGTFALDIYFRLWQRFAQIHCVDSMHAHLRCLPRKWRASP